MKKIIHHDTYLVPAKPENYMSVRHLALKGTNEEIGFALADLAKKEYDVTPQQYVSPLYAQARLEYFARNWPEMVKRMQGVAKAFDLDLQDTLCDASELVYDVPPEGMACSAVFLPGELTTTGHPLLARNYDYYRLTFSEIRHEAPKPGEHHVSDRSLAVELHPVDGGYTTLALSGMNMLNPFLDVMNEFGLFITSFVDPDAPFIVGAPFSGGFSSGLSVCQLPQMLAAKCATVAEAKRELLAHRILVGPKGLHWLIADANGAATALEIDAGSGGYVFTDAKPGRPFIVTNYHLFTHPDYRHFPKLDMTQEHNPFVRRRLLDDAIERHSGKFSKKDLSALLDVVLCAFVDDTKAGVTGGLPERTLITHTTDLLERTVEARFFLGDIGPVAGTNHLKIRRSDPIAIGFQE